MGRRRADADEGAIALGEIAGRSLAHVVLFQLELCLRLWPTKSNPILTTPYVFVDTRTRGGEAQMRTYEIVGALGLVLLVACDDAGAPVAVSEEALVGICDEDCPIGPGERAIVDAEIASLERALRGCASAEERMACRAATIEAIRESLADPSGLLDCAGAQALRRARERIHDEPAPRADVLAIANQVVQNGGRWVPTATDLTIQAELQAAYAAARDADPGMAPLPTDLEEHWVEQVEGYDDLVLPQTSPPTECHGPTPRFIGDPEAVCNAD